MLEDTIRKLVALLKEADVDEIEVRRFWTTVRVAKRRHTPSASPSREPVDGTVVTVEAPLPAPASADAPATAEQEQAATTGPAGTEAGEPSAPIPGEITIYAPMVGTFYRARDPQSKPFVDEGTEVDVGDVLCVIEAMKLMNEIEADAKCVIRKILVEDAQPVEYGQPLFMVESA
jgi:acetyl-CoA carboxylase biotin carboxyl carrier protein